MARERAFFVEQTGARVARARPPFLIQIPKQRGADAFLSASAVSRGSPAGRDGEAERSASFKVKL